MLMSSISRPWLRHTLALLIALSLIGCGEEAVAPAPTPQAKPQANKAAPKKGHAKGKGKAKGKGRAGVKGGASDNSLETALLLIDETSVVGTEVEANPNRLWAHLWLHEPRAVDTILRELTATPDADPKLLAQLLSVVQAPPLNGLTLDGRALIAWPQSMTRKPLVGASAVDLKVLTESFPDPVTDKPIN